MKPLVERYPTPRTVDPSMWIEESIWCHRLHDEQTPWLALLEFLNVFFHEDSKNRAFEEPDGPNSLKYKPAKRLYLRNILFNNPRIDDVRFSDLNDSEKWARCFEEMVEAPGLITPRFAYLRTHFSSFADFWEAISLLRSTGLEISSNKRWTSKFVFPFGKECLFEDLDAKAKTNDRRFFGRSGEVLYLMFCRAKRRGQLVPLLKGLFAEDETMNTLCKCLQPGEEELASERGGAFLPYSEHECFDQMTDDWISLLKLDMPGFDKFPHLVHLSGFYLLYYQQMVACQYLKIPRPPVFVCEILAPKKTLVRELSIVTYQENNFLPSRVVEAFIQALQELPEWQNALVSEGTFQQCQCLLRIHAKWDEEEEYKGPNNPEALLKAFKEAAMKRHRQHVANIHRVYGREIGLISKRGTNRLRYAPNDAFLKSLIFANVAKRLELNQFLERLFQRYGLVFSDHQAELVFNKGELDKKAFQGNVERLEQRLASLGLLRRLSDGCAYIVNPYFRKEYGKE